MSDPSYRQFKTRDSSRQRDDSSSASNSGCEDNAYSFSIMRCGRLSDVVVSGRCPPANVTNSDVNSGGMQIDQSTVRSGTYNGGGSITDEVLSHPPEVMGLSSFIKASTASTSSENRQSLQLTSQSLLSNAVAFPPLDPIRRGQGHAYSDPPLHQGIGDNNDPTPLYLACAPVIATPHQQQLFQSIGRNNDSISFQAVQEHQNPGHSAGPSADESPGVFQNHVDQEEDQEGNLNSHDSTENRSSKKQRQHLSEDNLNHQGQISSNLHNHHLAGDYQRGAANFQPFNFPATTVAVASPQNFQAMLLAQQQQQQWHLAEFIGRDQIYPHQAQLLQQPQPFRFSLAGLNPSINIPGVSGFQSGSPSTSQLSFPLPSLQSHSQDTASQSNSRNTRAHRSRNAEHYSTRQVMTLETEGDSIWLSEFLCFLRSHCCEVFTSSAQDVQERRRSKQINLNQVGIRCRFCAHLPHHERAGRSSCYPSSVERIYQSVTMMIREHFPVCDEFPADVRRKYVNLKKNTKKGEMESKTHWKNAALELGMRNSVRGIYFENLPLASDDFNPPEPEIDNFTKPEGYNPNGTC